MKYIKSFSKILAFTVILIFGGCTSFSHSAANQTPENLNAINSDKTDKTMTINFGKINFAVPAGFPAPEGFENSGQTSEYEKASQFVSPDNEPIAESLEAGWEFESSKTLEAINAEVKEKMQNTGVYKIESDTEKTIDGYPSKIIKASAENQKEPKIYTFVAHIKSGENKFVRISFDTEAGAETAQATFDKIVSSITFNRHNAGKPKTPTAENFKRYDAGDLSLDVPTTMKPKQSSGTKNLRIEQFPDQTWNQEQIVFNIGYFNEENIASKTDLVKQIENSQASDAIAGRSSESFDTGNFKGDVSRLSLNVPELENAEGKTAVLIAEGKTKDNTIVQLKGESPFSKRGEMEKGFREILNTVKSQQ